MKCNKGKRILIFILLLVFTTNVSAQFFNKEVAAKIKVDKTSEFYQFTAVAENLTPSDVSLRYEFMVFKTDVNDNTSKSSQGDRFVLGATQQKLLSTLTINYSVEGKIILLLLIYDQEDKPIGKDRLVLEDGGKTVIETAAPPVMAAAQDQAAPQDGVYATGLIIENTITKTGRDFYRLFSQDYLNRGIKTNKNILIEEVPGRGRNTRITVKVDDQLVWQFFAQPTRKILLQNKDVAMDRTIRQLQYLQQQKNNFIRY